MNFVIPPHPVSSVEVTGTDERFPVRRIYCIGRNYLAHIREMGNDERKPPFFFQKPPDALLPTTAEMHIGNFGEYLDLLPGIEKATFDKKNYDISK